MNSIVSIVLSELLVFFGSFLLFNYLLNNYLLTFLRAKSGKGKFAVVEVYGLNGVYCRLGTFKEALVSYKNRNKIVKDISGVEKEFVYYKFGVPHVFFDEVGDKILKPDFSGVTGHDGARVNNLLVRAITAPTLDQSNLLKIAILILVFEFLVLIGVGFFVFKLNQNVTLLQASVSSLNSQLTTLLAQTKGVV